HNKQERIIERNNKEVTLKDYQYETNRKDASKIWDSEDVTSVYDENRKVQYYDGTVQDVTSVKQAQERLTESEERYRLLFASNPQALWVSDPKTLKVLAVN